MTRPSSPLTSARLRFPSSLRWRLTAWVAAVMLISVAIIFYVVYRDTGSELRAQIDRDVIEDTAQTTNVLAGRSDGSPRQLAAAARTYVQAQPYDASSTLLFVLGPNDAAAFNHQEIVSRSGADDGEAAAERASEARIGTRLLTPRLGFTVQQVPDV